MHPSLRARRPARRPPHDVTRRYVEASTTDPPALPHQTMSRRPLPRPAGADGHRSVVRRDVLDRSRPARSGLLPGTLQADGDPTQALRRYERRRALRVRRVAKMAASERTNRPPSAALGLLRLTCITTARRPRQHSTAVPVQQRPEQRAAWTKPLPSKAAVLAAFSECDRTMPVPTSTSAGRTMAR